LLASETEKDDVNEDRGGIVKVDPTIPSRGEGGREEDIKARDGAGEGSVAIASDDRASHYSAEELEGVGASTLRPREEEKVRERCRAGRKRKCVCVCVVCVRGGERARERPQTRRDESGCRRDSSELSPGVSNRSSAVSGGGGFSGRLKKCEGQVAVSGQSSRSSQAKLSSPSLHRSIEVDRTGHGDTDLLYGQRESGWARTTTRPAH